jgi:hypothetical protein
MDWRFLVTLICTVAFGIATIVLALKLVKKRQPVWAYKTTKIIGLGSNAPPELKLTFNEQPVSDVYRTRVIFFNKGIEAIVKENVTESIVMHFKGANILRQPTILAKSREGIGMSAKQVVKDGDNAVEVSFQYLDHNDGAVIEVLHTTSQDIKPSGNIIGTSEIRYIGEFAPIPDRPIRRTIMRIMMVIFMVGIMSWGLLVKGPNEPLDTRWIIAIYIFGLLTFSAMLVPEVAPFLRSRRFPRWSAVTD